MKLAFISCLFGALTAALAAEPLPVASLSTVLTDIARNVGGDRVTVTNIIQPGVDPHDFQPTPRDVRALSKARIILASGLGFESYLEKLRSAVGPGPTFVVVGDAIKPLMVTDHHDHDHGHDHGHAHGPDGKMADPHWWHSISNARIATRVIRDALIAADPAGKSAYEANARAYMVKLDDLARWAKVQVARVPRSQRILVTSHDALGYFARDYGFEIHPVEGISTGDQPSSKRVRELITLIKTDGVKAIFAENIENPKVVGEITRETGARLGGTLYADGLGPAEAATYEDMMRHNVTVIVTGLSGGN